MLADRADLRARRVYPAADALRTRVQAAGFVVSDMPSGTRVRPALRPDALVGCFSTAREVASRLDEPDQRDVSVLLHVYGWPGDVERCVASVLRAADLGAYDVEIVVVDSQVERDTRWLDDLAARESRVRVLLPDHPLGEAEGRNAALKQALGRVVILMDTSVEATGDFLTPLLAALDAPDVGVAGPWGLRSHNLRQFHEVGAGDVDAMQGYCFAFRRALVREVGLMDEKFRYYRHLDLDYSFRFRDRGYRIVALPGLPLVRHEHRGWEALGHDEREKRSKRNFYHFLSRWGTRYDLRVPESARH
jgi:cysteinyl-tRNA synthetase